MNRSARSMAAADAAATAADVAGSTAGDSALATEWATVGDDGGDCWRLARAAKELPPPAAEAAGGQLGLAMADGKGENPALLEKEARGADNF